MCGRQSGRTVAVVKNSEHLDKQAGVTEDGDQWNVSSPGFEKYKLKLKMQSFSFFFCYILGLRYIGVLVRVRERRFLQVSLNLF